MGEVTPLEKDKIRKNSHVNTPSGCERGTYFMSVGISSMCQPYPVPGSDIVVLDYIRHVRVQLQHHHRSQSLVSDNLERSRKQEESEAMISKLRVKYFTSFFLG